MKIIGETLINNVHFARSIVLVYHSIPKINWGSFRGRCEEKWGSFRGRFGDYFRVGDHFGPGRTLYSNSKEAIIAVLMKIHLLVFY